MTLRTISYGGGVQSTAMLVLAATGRIDFDVALFCNVGEDAEHPDTLRYVREVAMPYAATNGIEVVELHKVRVRGAHKGPESLLDRLTRPESMSLPIPVRMSNGAPGNRGCTITYKLEVMAKWHKDHGATPEHPATVAIGFSTDEAHRVERAQPRAWELVTYPLLDLRLNRDRCMTVIRSAGLPVPGKSSC
jgi:3'-phosphoadenosine 5'-phosphosulfate sulfotransferase (PAPS reductase)/FAD synthetase